MFLRQRVFLMLRGISLLLYVRAFIVNPCLFLLPYTALHPLILLPLITTTPSTPVLTTSPVSTSTIPTTTIRTSPLSMRPITSITITQIRRRRRGCCSNLVLRRTPRPHDMKLRQHGLRSWPCWLPDAGNHPPVKTARKGTPHEKSSSPVRAAFFVVLIGAVFPCYIAQRYRL